MDFAIGFLVGLATPWFWAIICFLVVATLWALSGDYESWITAGIFIILVVGTLYVRYRPDMETIGIGFVGWVTVGVVYSFWRWFWQIRKLRQRVDDAEKSRRKGGEYLEPNLSRCDLKKTRSAKSVTEFKPEFQQYRGVVALWTALWPIFFLRDLTIDLIETIQDILRNFYQRIADSAFKA